MPDAPPAEAAHPVQEATRHADRLGRPLTALTFTCVVVAAAATTGPLWGRADVSPSLSFWLGIGSGYGLIAAGVLAARWRSGRLIAGLLLLAAFFYFIPFLGQFARSDLLFTIGLATAGGWVAIGNHFVLAFPHGRLRSRVERGLVAAGYGWMVIGSALLNSVYHAADFGCPECPANLLLVARDPEFYALLRYPAGLIPTTIALITLGVLATRWHRATKPERRVLSPVVVAFGINIVTTSTAYLSVPLSATGILPADAPNALFTVQRAAVVLIPLGVVVGLVRNVLARASIGNLLVRIGQGRSPDEIERDIGWALGDPSARLAYRRGDGDGYVDRRGRPLEAGRAVSVIGESRDAVVALAHDPAIERHQPELLDNVLAGARLALDNQRLQTEVELSQTLPPGLGEQLRAAGRGVGEVEKLDISVLMSDVRGYATLAERADLQTLAGQLNDHRTAMNKAVVHHGGTVMQYAGDSVFAVFGAPTPLADHAQRAVDAAIEMQAVQRDINRAWQERGLPPFELGISVTSGEVAAAVLGSEEHLEYSVVGDVVNLAQRIQAWARRGEVIVDDATYGALYRPLNAERLAPATVKGRAALVTAHRIAPAEPASPRAGNLVAAS